MPVIRCNLMIVTDDGNDAKTKKGTQLNTVKKAIRVALAPDPVTNHNELGGAAEHCWIEGMILDNEGMLGQQALSIVPITIQPLGSDGYGGQWSYNTGFMYGIPSRSISGGDVDTTPLYVGGLKSVNVDTSLDVETVKGQLRFPVAAASKVARMVVRASEAQISGRAMAQMYLGLQPVATGALKEIRLDTTIPATGPYTITVTPAAGTITADLGALLAGVPMTYTPGTIAAGAYKWALASQGRAVWTFSSAQAGKAVTLKYLVSVGGTSSTISNTFRGRAPELKLVLVRSWAGQQSILTLNRCVPIHFAFQTALEDFGAQNVEFEVLGDLNGVIGTISTSEAYVAPT